MRVLRATHWSPDLQPTVMVMSEDDLKEGGFEEMLKPQPGVFTTTKVIEMDNPPEQPALTMKVMEVFPNEAQRERDMALLYYWNLFSPYADKVIGGGTLMQSKPSPLSVEEIKTVFEQIAIHPKFKKKPVNMMALSEDMETVTLTSEGKIR